MDYKSFERDMLKVKSNIDRTEELQNVLGGVFDFGDSVCFPLDLISRLYDLDLNMLDWFVFELDFGIKGSGAITVDGVTYDVTSIDELWVNAFGRSI